MSLDLAFRRLAIRTPTLPLCQQCCRRAITTSSPTPLQSNATAAFTDLLQNNSSQSSTTTSARTATPTRPSSPSSTDALSSSSTISSTSVSPTDSPGWSLARQAVEAASAVRRQQVQRQMTLDAERGWNRQDLERQAVHRRWQPGHVYAPHDLTGIEMAKWKRVRRRQKPKVDVVDQLALKPKDLYKNFSVMSEYMTEMGRIKHSSETNLRPVNQRRMAKAIRRAIGLGILMPSTHRHPEILRMEMGGMRKF